MKKKVSELENKLKLNEYKYLLYIREQQNRIGNLEKELKIKEIADSNDINEIRCFPNLTKYNYNDKIKPKLIPLSESILKYNSSKKKKNINNKRKKSIKDSFLTITNSISKNQIIKNISNSKNKVKGTDYNNHTFQKLNNERNDNSIQNWQKSVDYLKQKIFKGDEEIPKYNSNTSRTNPKTNLHRYEDDDYNINNIKEGLNESIINKDKTYYISHPNLTIAGIVNRKNKFYKGLPNKNLTFKFSKNLEKNAFFKFPSTLKETLVNLEKLRINKNYKDKNDT